MPDQELPIGVAVSFQQKKLFPGTDLLICTLFVGGEEEWVVPMF
jgi:hypothetical protein